MTRPLPILIPLGRGSRSGNDELRLLLRSIEANVAEDVSIVIVTDCVPDWIDARRIEVVEVPDGCADCKDRNLIEKTLTAIESLGLDEFGWCADDNAFLMPIEFRNMPVLYVGKRDFAGAGARWIARCIATRRYFGVTHDYESHAPQYFGNAKGILEGMARIPWRDIHNGLTVMTALRLSARSGEENELPRELVHESAVFARDARLCAFRGVSLSYTDDAFIDGGLRERLFGLFGKRSKYEL